MATHTDQLQRKITIDQIPKRIICLVPSITELLFDLGVGACVVGRTKFCVHPQGQVKTAQIVGGTKKVHFDRIAALKPDLIIANKEENNQEQIEQLAKMYVVWISDVPHFEAGLELIGCLGKILNRTKEAGTIVAKLQQCLPHIKTAFQQKHGLLAQERVAYLIWQKPYMGVGTDTYIHDMLQRLGYQNVFAPASRYPSCTLEALQALQPAAIFLSSEPYPFQQKHIVALSHFFPNIPIVLVDGELFSWYGSRLLHLAHAL